jgi:hypothetical protein
MWKRVDRPDLQHSLARLQLGVQAGFAGRGLLNLRLVSVGGPGPWLSSDSGAAAGGVSSPAADLGG